VSDPARRPEPANASEEAPADEEYARTYAAGFEEGLRSALKELLAHASRGHTNQELRALIQSRLARLADEVDLKRRSLLAPPRPKPWDSLSRPHAAPAGNVEALTPSRLTPGTSLLVCEERPKVGIEVARSNVGRFPRVVTVSSNAPDLGVASPERLVRIDVGAPGTAAPDHLTPGEVLGRLLAPTGEANGALVYVDALEFFVTAEGLEPMLRFVQRLVDQVNRTGSALVVSFHPRSIEEKDQSRLERSFGQVRYATGPRA
jgi:hypothetical protein